MTLRSIVFVHHCSSSRLGRRRTVTTVNQPLEHKTLKHIRFTIDGRSFTTDDADQHAADLLKLAGLDPAGYDLAEIRPGAHKPHEFADNALVHIKDGAKFVSIRQRAEVA
jgi:hypothetical protein